jgi:hypothetical protein
MRDDLINYFNGKFGVHNHARAEINEMPVYLEYSLSENMTQKYRYNTALTKKAGGV